MGCFGRIFLLLLLLVAAWAGWRWGGDFFPGLESRVSSAVEQFRDGRGSADDVEPDPALGEAVLIRYEQFASGQDGDSLVLTGVEISSLLEYQAPGLLPAGIDRPRVAFEDGSAVLSVRAAVSALPSFPELSGVREILPDTVTLDVRGRMEPFAGGTALRVESIDASRIPLPRRVFPSILEALGRRDEPGLPSDAVAVPLPRGVGSIYIPGDRLVLRSGR